MSNNNLYTQEGPYSLELSSEKHRMFVFFELSVLETYRNDPRYYYSHNDFIGSISIKDEFYKDKGTPDKDKALLQIFGFGYDENFNNRYVVAFLHHLAALPVEHQLIWKANEVEGDSLYVHPVFYRRAFLGEPIQEISVFDAFLEEMQIINQICDLMGKPNLFRKVYTEGSRPKGFSFLIRPTLKELNDFILLLDKLLSDNLNKRFFNANTESNIEKGKGSEEQKNKGTITLLEEWGKSSLVYSPDDEKTLTEIIKIFRDIRNLRRNPAHVIEEDCFDMEYFRKQRYLIIDAYKALKSLRLLFYNHPSIKGREHEIKIDERLKTGKIWTR